MSTDTPIREQKQRYWPILAEGFLYAEIFPLFKDERDRMRVQTWVTGRMNDWPDQDFASSGRVIWVSSDTVHDIIRHMDAEEVTTLYGWCEMAMLVFSDALTRDLVVEASEPGTIRTISDIFVNLMRWALNRKFVLAHS